MMVKFRGWNLGFWPFRRPRQPRQPRQPRSPRKMNEMQENGEIKKPTEKPIAPNKP